MIHDTHFFTHFAGNAASSGNGDHKPGLLRHRSSDGRVSAETDRPGNRPLSCPIRRPPHG